MNEVFRDCLSREFYGLMSLMRESWLTPEKVSPTVDLEQTPIYGSMYFEPHVSGGQPVEILLNVTIKYGDDEVSVGEMLRRVDA